MVHHIKRSWGHETLLDSTATRVLKIEPLRKRIMILDVFCTVLFLITRVIHKYAPDDELMEG